MAIRDNITMDLSLTFDDVQINAVFAARVLQVLVNAGTSLHRIPLADIVIFTPKQKEPPFVLQELISYGNKIGDCLVFLQVFAEDTCDAAGAATPANARWRMMIHHDPTDKRLVAHTTSQVAKLVACHAIYAMVRAGPPSEPVPRFIKEQIGVTYSAGVMNTLFSNTNPANWDLTWVQEIDWASVGQQTLMRFGLGVAGYRLISVFGLYTPKPGLDANLLEACATMAALARIPYCWEIHPVTRTALVQQLFGNLNKNCMNLILEAFSARDLAIMQGKSLSAAADQRHDPAHVQYRTWNRDLLKQISYSQIF